MLSEINDFAIRLLWVVATLGVAIPTGFVTANVAILFDVPYFWALCICVLTIMLLLYASERCLDRCLKRNKKQENKVEEIFNQKESKS